MLFAHFHQDEVYDSGWAISKNKAPERTFQNWQVGQDYHWSCKRSKSMNSHCHGRTIKPRNLPGELHDTLGGNESLGYLMNRQGLPPGLRALTYKGTGTRNKEWQEVETAAGSVMTFTLIVTDKQKDNKEGGLGPELKHGRRTWSTVPTRGLLGV